jgi:hypothetical protein
MVHGRMDVSSESGPYSAIDPMLNHFYLLNFLK